MDVSTPLAGLQKKTPPMDRGFTIPYKIECYNRNLAAPVGIKYI